MNILLANDDGINSPGIYALCKALSTRADVYVCAPHIQRSAASHGITMGVSVQLQEVPAEFASRAFKVTGTPADCVKIGVGYLEDTLGIPVDYVFSGINLGSNLGTDVLYSGTVSAAIEGAMRGRSSVAVSVASHEPTHYEYACDLALELLDEIVARDEIVTYNLNVPDLPPEKIKGVRITRLGVKGYNNVLRHVPNDEGVFECYYYGDPKIYKSKNISIDVIAHQEGYASITPLQYDLTNHRQIGGLRHLER